MMQKSGLRTTDLAFKTVFRLNGKSPYSSHMNIFYRFDRLLMSEPHEDILELTVTNHSDLCFLIIIEIMKIKGLGGLSCVV